MPLKKAKLLFGEEAESLADKQATGQTNQEGAGRREVEDGLKIEEPAGGVTPKEALIWAGCFTWLGALRQAGGKTISRS